MKELKAVSIAEFKELATRNLKLKKDVYVSFFQECIDNAGKYALGPYFWLIPDQTELTVAAASPNIGKLSPFNESEWLDKEFSFWLKTMHPEDVDFAVSSFALSIEIHQSMPTNKAETVHTNLYLRMQDKDSKFRWVLIQFPKRMYDSTGKVISTLILITDLSHLGKNISRMLSIIDTSNDKNIILATSVIKDKLEKVPIPIISRRELELLQLMASGLNTPQIAKALFLSYHTVENHKRNLRKKTNTKTSAELIDFVWRNNLI